MMLESPKQRIQDTHTHLWCSIVWAATAGFQEVAVTHDVGQAKIRDFDVHLGVQQQVFGLQLSMHDLRGSRLGEGDWAAWVSW